MKDQASQLQESGIKCWLSCDDCLPVKDLTHADVSKVYVTPEALKQTQWRRLLCYPMFQTRLCFFAVDEAHCVSDWGYEFRPEFRDLSEIQSVVDVPLLAITATGTERVREDIVKYLQISDNAFSIAIVPDRPNITLVVKSTGSERYEEELQWLLDYARVHIDNESMAKTIIFCRSYRMVYGVWSWLLDAIGLKVYAEEKHTVKGRRVEMFTASTTEKDKNRILDNFKNGRTRIIVSTVAFGMGVNIPNVSLVVHWGAPKSFLTYWQEVGRAGREEKQALAVLIPYKRSCLKSMCVDDFTIINNYCICQEQDTHSFAYKG
ncbi:uncharacterized protein LOC127859955 [Dreissena polymorpha]|uniref:uncharacterized protein LOC127859955 n=1 Tax=Dreissena polymorpha TaxID=45954 RepID=UPI002263B82B|nr:uncharacterized protein LOC127859955 [Dreissena polymorpha]